MSPSARTSGTNSTAARTASAEPSCSARVTVTRGRPLVSAASCAHAARSGTVPPESNTGARFITSSDSAYVGASKAGTSREHGLALGRQCMRNGGRQGVNGAARARCARPTARGRTHVERPPQERHARAAAGARLEPDDALHRLHVAEAPELEALLDVHQLLAISYPSQYALRVLVDGPEHGQHARRGAS